RVANALWGQRGEGFLPAYLELVRDDYGAALEEVDFKGGAERARRQINAWVEKQTDDKIRELLAQGVVTPRTRLVVTNAVSFKGDWAEQFPRDATHDEPFKAPGGETTVPLMHRTGKYGYHEAEGLQVLEMPYQGKDLSMVVLLPRAGDGLAALEKGLTAEKLAGWVGRLREQTVRVIVPRFKTTAQ